MARTSRNWVFTINNPTTEHHERMHELVADGHCLSLKCETEIGDEEGTPHIQGAVQWDNNVKPSVCKKRLGGKCYVHLAMGTWEDQDYCNKDPVEHPDGWKYCINFGEGWKGQGNRSELQEFRYAIGEGVEEESLLDHHLSTVAKYPRLEARLKQARMKKVSREWRDVEVHVVWGAAGVGKSRGQIYGEDGMRGDNYVVDHNNDNLKWWDGYEGEKTIILEEFSGDVCNLDKFLRLTDGHQMRLEIKGGHTYAMWTTVLINSNIDPQDWYDFRSVDKRDAFNRRISTVKRVRQVNI